MNTSTLTDKCPDCRCDAKEWHGLTCQFPVYIDREWGGTMMVKCNCPSRWEIENE